MINELKINCGLLLISNVQIAFISSDLLGSSLFGITCFWLIPLFDFGL